jgi:M6 family metalloprotease-like protein
VSCSLLFAAPSSREPIVHQQGGAEWKIYQKGDEFLSWHETSDSYIVGQNASGNWELMSLKANEQFALTGIELASGQNFSGNAKASMMSSANLRMRKVQRWSKVKNAPSLSAIGQKSQLVILAGFKDHLDAQGAVLASHRVGEVSGSEYQRRMTTGTNSVSSYFSGVSRSQMSLSTHVTPWLALPKTEAEYGMDVSGNKDLGLETLVLDALAVASGNTNLSGMSQTSSYDWVTVIHSGRDQARATASTHSNRIWSTSGNLTSSSNYFGGNVVVQRYVVASGHGGLDEKEAGDLGVLCHEISHLLGLPDLYEYSEAGSAVGSWGLMGVGAWGVTGNAMAKSSAATLSAWSKIQLGWETPTLLDVSGNAYSLSPVQNAGEIYKLPTDTTTEYFLMEVRDSSAETWSDMPSSWGKGALIWHVDERAWSSLAAADFIHPLVKLEEADGNDSLGGETALAESGDLWSGNSVLSSFTTAALKTGSSRVYDSSNYYDRSTAGGSSGHHLYDFLESSSLFFNATSRRSRLEIKDFANGIITWWPVHGETSYILQRTDLSTGTTSEFSVSGLSYTDVTIPVLQAENVNYDFRVRPSQSTTAWSAVMHYGLLLSSASFDAHTGVVSFNWNLPVLVKDLSTFNLSGVQVKSSSGNLIFSMAGSGSLSLFSYPAKKDGDAFEATYITSSTELNSVQVKLSDVQRYEWIAKSNDQNDNLYIEVARGVARSLSSGNITNPPQNLNLSNAVKVSSSKDTTAATLLSAQYSHDNGTLDLYYNEPLFMTSLTPSSFHVYGADGNTTDLNGSTFTVHGNLLSFVLSGDRRIRSALISSQNGNALNIKTSNAVLDISGIAANAADFSGAKIVPDTTPPFVKSFKMDLRDESRVLNIEFSEPVFFPSAPSGNTFGFQLGNADFSKTAMGGNIVGGSDTVPELFQSSLNFAGASIVLTTAVNLDLTEAEVDGIDEFYGLFVNPAPLAYARFSTQSFYDYPNSLIPSLSVDTTSVTFSANYQQRRRARFIHPHYDSAVTLPLSQESLIWKWKHRLAFQVNGGWSGNELLRVEWENAILGQNALIKENISLSGNIADQLMDSEQYLPWDTRDVVSSEGYQLKIYRQDRVKLYDWSRLVEVDNVAPELFLSYISNSTPSTKVNANDIVDESLYDFPISSANKTKTNLIIVATFTEPVIQAPSIFIDQAGRQSGDTFDTMRSKSGNAIDSVWFFPYDVKVQDAGDHADGLATVYTQDVPDRAVGHIVAGNGLSSSSSEVVGNISLNTVQAGSTRVFSIDTIPPTIASLDFAIRDQSIVDPRSVLEVYFSENLYNPTGSDNTYLVNGLPVTGVLEKNNYQLGGTGAIAVGGQTLRVLSVTGEGQGPYTLLLDGVVDRGALELSMVSLNILDFHNNAMGLPNSAVAFWPGPLHNRNEVFLSVGGRTRLLMSGGFPAYSYVISPFYSGVAKIAPDQTSILGLGLGRYTVEVTESRQQTRFVNAEVLPPYSTSVTNNFDAYRDELDFQMVSFPFNLETWDGEGVFKILQEGAGTVGVDYGLFTYKDNGYQAVISETTEVGPGYGFWMATRKKKTVEISGEGALPEQVVGIDLHYGWNLIGNPFDQPIEASKIYVSTAGTRFSIKDLSQSETQHEIWYIDISMPRYEALTELKAFQAAWLYVNNPKGTELIFFRGVENADYPVDYSPWPRTKTEVEGRSNASLYPPSRPGDFVTGASRVAAASSVTSLGSSSGGGGGGGGCFFR